MFQEKNKILETSIQVHVHEKKLSSCQVENSAVSVDVSTFSWEQSKCLFLTVYRVFHLSWGVKIFHEICILRKKCL